MTATKFPTRERLLGDEVFDELQLSWAEPVPHLVRYYVSVRHCTSAVSGDEWRFLWRSEGWGPGGEHSYGSLSEAVGSMGTRLLETIHRRRMQGKVTMTLRAKNAEVVSVTYPDITECVLRLPMLIMTHAERADPKDRAVLDKLQELRDRTCFQPGCSKPATVTFRLRRRYSPDRTISQAVPRHHRYIRLFCKEHCRRGNCSREDCDMNYMLVKEGPSSSDEAPAKKTRPKP